MGTFKGGSEFTKVDIEGASGKAFAIDLEVNLRCGIDNPYCWEQLETLVTERGYGMSHTAWINNFSIQHLVSHPLESQRMSLLSWASKFQRGLSKLAADGQQPPKMFFLNGSFLHAFREASTTNARMAALNGFFEKVLGSMGFETVDAYAMESARVYASSDGMHFDDYMNYVMVQSFLHQLRHV